MDIEIIRAEVRANIVIQLIRIEIEGVNTYVLKAFQIRMLGSCHNIHTVKYGHDERAHANEHYSNWMITESDTLKDLLSYKDQEETC